MVSAGYADLRMHMISIITVHLIEYIVVTYDIAALSFGNSIQTIPFHCEHTCIWDSHNSNNYDNTESYHGIVMHYQALVLAAIL